MNSSRQYRIFVSSVQKEFAEERQALKAFIENDPLLRRFFTVFLFEDLPASNQRADAVYLAEVDRCAIYLGLFGNDYGIKDATGVSPTEHEFNRATIQGKARLVFIKGTNDKKRHPKMQALIHKAGSQLIRRRFNSIAELTAEIYASLVEYLEISGVIQSRPFDQRLCMDATLDSLDAQAVKNFVRLARTGRQFPLPEEAPLDDVLTHLHLLRAGQLTNAALLLFGRDPQGFLPAAEIRCMHFHGMEIVRPVPFYRIFKGTVFAQVDMAVDFVMSKLNRSVGTRAESSQAPVRYEIPPDVIHEAIVNAVAHRDYTSSGAVQVSVFADRVEIWNPGALPAPLTPESLRHPHGSIARNHRLCEAFFLAQYIEKYGTGTLMMIRECLAHQLPEPAFVQRGGEFTMTLWRDWLTEELLASYGLNDRQMKAMAAIRQKSSLSTMDYQALTGAARSTAKRDLEDLVGRGILLLQGSGRGTFYELSKKRPINGPNGPSATQGLNLNAPVKGSQRAQIVQAHVAAQVEAHVARQAPDKLPISTPPVTLPVTPPVRSLIELLGKHGELGAFAVREELGLKDRTYVREAYLNPSLEAGYIEYTIPEKPRSSKQKYRLTEKGRAWLVERKQ